MIRAFVVDDEPLAVRRLERLLAESGRVTVAGSATDPERAIEVLKHTPVDVLFLDIEMPGSNGFELLARLNPQPLVVFTTAYDRYALQAFEVHSVDYLLKPVEAAQLDRALGKLERIGQGAEPRPDLHRLLDRLHVALEAPQRQYPRRLPSRVGERVYFVDLDLVTHFYAEDKLTYAATEARAYVVDATIGELEQRLDPARFFRIHRATLVNLDFLLEMDSWFGGRVLIRLKDQKRTELTVARDRVRVLRERLLG
ncbi:MAG: response regulator transcription factor [Bryobacterales bacterium]|nr:response regulator transcription factor [Bryobacterales bacterium]